MSFRFRPEMFKDLPDVELHRTEEVIAHEANRLLDEHVKTLPEVTMRARLWDIQEIKPKECEHKPNPWGMSMQYDEDTKTSHATCLCHCCGKRLVAEWKEAE